MEQSEKTRLRWLVFGAMVIATIAFPWIGLPMLAYAGYRVGSWAVRSTRNIIERLAYNYASRTDGASPARSKSVGMSRKVFSKKDGWDLSAIPTELGISARKIYEPSAEFDYYSRKGFVKAVSDARGAATFSFGIDESQKDRLDAVRNLGIDGYSMKFDGRDGRYVLSTKDPAVLKQLLAAAFPPVAAQVSKDITHTRQYVVRGMYSFEEAKKFVLENMDGITPVASSYVIESSVNGKTAKVSHIGGLLKGEELPALGERDYIVNLQEKDHFAGMVMVDPFVDSSQMRSSAVEQFVSSENNRRVVSGEEALTLSDGMVAGVRRKVDMGEGFELDLRSKNELRENPLFLHCALRDREELERFLSEGKLPEGREVFVNRLSSVEQQTFGGDYVTVPVDGEILGRLALQGDSSASVAARAAAKGVDREDLAYTLLVNEVGNVGFSQVKLSGGDLSVGSAVVNGVPAREISSRLDSDRLPSLDTQEAVNKWIADASRIKSVTMVIDQKKAEMRITSLVGDSLVEETRKLTHDEVRDLGRRGKVSDWELKDLMMQLRPDLFRSYSENGRSNLLGDALTSFVRGENLETSLTKARRLSQKQKSIKEEKKTAKTRTLEYKPAGPKL